MIGRRLPLGEWPKEPGDYVGPIVGYTGDVPAAFFLKPNARDPGRSVTICNRRCTLPSLDSHGRSYMGCGYCPRRTAGEIRSLQGCPERLFDQKN